MKYRCVLPHAEIRDASFSFLNIDKINLLQKIHSHFSPSLMKMQPYVCRRHVMTRKIRINLVIIAIGTLCLHGCDDLRREPVHSLASYGFRPDTPLAARTAGPPAVLLDYLKKLDRSPEYEPYLPGVKELEAVSQALSKLPPLHREVMRSRLVGMYFIKNFRGSGLTDWVVDAENNVYAIMVFNASVFSKSISALLTEREQTCFIPDDPSYEVSIDCGTRYGAFMYILLHESTHLVDYVKNITPFTDPQVKKYLRIRPTETNITRDIWKEYDVPRSSFIFTHRVVFYGFASPGLKISEAERVYSELSGSPFISLYGSQSWAEDLAELATFYHLSRTLNQPYVIRVAKSGKNLLTLYPLNAPEVKKRLPMIQKYFYSN